MLPTHFLKRYFPTAPDWILGRAFVVFLLWLLVFPVDTLQFVIRQEFLPATYLGRIIRSLYILGFWISINLTPLWRHSFLTLSQLRLIVVFLGLLISSPVYFILGALLAVRKIFPILLGITLLAIKILFGI